MASILLFLYQKFVLLFGIISFSIYKYLLPLFGSHLFRRHEVSKKESPKNREISSSIETETKSNHDLGNFTNGFSKNEETEISFQFKFPSYEEFCAKRRENVDIKGSTGFTIEPEILEINDKNDVAFGEIERISNRVLSIDENYVEIKSEEAKKLPKQTEEERANEGTEEEIQLNDKIDEPFGDKERISKRVLLIDENYMEINSEEEKKLPIETERENQGEEEEEIRLNFKSESVCSSLVESFTNRLIESYNDDFLSDSDFGEEFEFENERQVLDEIPKIYENVNENNSVNEEDLYTLEELKEIEYAHYKILGKFRPEFLSVKDFCDDREINFEKIDSKNISNLAKLGENEKYLDHEEHMYTIEELRKIEEMHYENLGKLKSDFTSEKKICDENKNALEKTESENISSSAKLDENEKNLDDEEHMYTIEDLRKIEEMHYENTGKLKSDFVSEKNLCDENENDLKNKSDWDSDSDELWEHQELIEQLKMELKNVKATGLPTILEESESPKITDDLKPWKIDEKLLNANRTGELQKFYKSYRDRMRKLDILNYQKMYTIGFLQLKDPVHSNSPPKSYVPSGSTLLTHNLFPSKSKKIGNDPMMKFIFELQGDLEIIYVGQMCLSWEILHWQYGKALELWEKDPHCIRIYNEVAGDFQQFQVLLQRFIEDEPFHGPRVQNYVKSRCALRNLLQVPLIKEDNLKDKKKAFKRREIGDFAITSDTLVEIMEESIRIFWNFVRADKDCSNVTVKSRKGLHIELQDPADSELLMEVQTNLQKKEKKLKDILRGGKCILKKFKKCEEDDSDQVLYFFSQVDMKLVGRVLNMPKITTDQLIWCRDKLQKISFVSKKIQVEPSFLLFPC